ncbi:sirohydrochlorin chelatase [Streptomyces sp. NPDC047108]|uniref:sirohydrochlorin chelatase n=1 Tax=Streptomyces sp. NPDC047108 TaxID=3155025 RepID=UPI00340A4A89
MTTPPALLIAAQGTRDEAGAEAFRALIRELRRRNPGLPVAGGFTDRSAPPLTDAVSELVEQGVRRLAAVPLTLVSAGQTGHAGDSVPAALAREQERHPGVAYRYGRPLGAHPKVLAVLERRLEEALGERARKPSDRAGTTVLLVGGGSTDAGANAEVHRAARLLWEGRGFAGVETAFVSLAAPDVPSGLDRCVRLGARRIVVLPYFLFTGGLPERVRMQTEGWAAAHPEVDVLPAEVIGSAEELADAVMERYREAVEGGDGDSGTSCASCSDRGASPVSEGEGARPEQPLEHPADESGDHDHRRHGPEGGDHLHGGHAHAR